MDSTCRTGWCGDTRSATQAMSAPAPVAREASSDLRKTYALGTLPASSSAFADDRDVEHGT
jgi:hypothetical protein